MNLADDTARKRPETSGLFCLVRCRRYCAGAGVVGAGAVDGAGAGSAGVGAGVAGAIEDGGSGFAGSGAVVVGAVGAGALISLLPLFR